MGSNEATKTPQPEAPPAPGQAALPAGRVLAASDATPLLRSLKVRHDAAPTSQYTVAGQYLKVQAPGSGGPAGMFALAQAPGRELELLVKRGSPVADSLAALVAGDVVLLSGAQGKGFPVTEAVGKDVWLFAVGSGIAPIRALVQALVEDRARHGKVTLYEGQREPEHFGFATERAAWRAAGVTVVEVLSRPHHNWAGRTGHVQDALLEDRPDGTGAVAYLCGMKGMVEGVRETAQALGLPRERTFLNY